MTSAQTPFVLLDDLRPAGGRCRRYVDPVEIVEARTPDAVEPAMRRLREARAQGRHAAGFLGYEAGLALEQRVQGLARPLDDGAPPLLWFGVFAAVETISPETLLADLPMPAGAWAGPPHPRIDAASYGARFERVAEYIRAGDVYQTNLSFRADVPVAGHPLALYARLRGAANAGWGGVVFTGQHWLLSLSPELFFTLEAGVLTARPMKGTAPRGTTPEADATAAATLQADPKERAENLMIVDLIRNDLARVAVAGSVAVPALFTVETYPTLHTLTSTVTARLSPGLDGVDALAALFPCGSITGAPKIRAMEVIAELEDEPRGPYTGSIGWLDPTGDAAFNVAIRTLVLADGASVAELGLGSGVVADSSADAEWSECLAKAAFVTRDSPTLALIETMYAEPTGVRDLDRHLARLSASAQALGFVTVDVRQAAHDAALRLTAPARLRLLLWQDGSVEVTTTPLPAPVATPVDVALAPLPVASHDFRLRHKTTDRSFYDDARVAAGAFEVVFVDDAGFLTEGSFTSVFVARDGMFLTPPLGRGLLPGVLRQRLIDEGRAREADLRAEDLTGDFLIGNALRGLMPARLVKRGDAAHDGQNDRSGETS